MRAAAGEALPAADPGGTGAYCLVLSGSVVDGRDYPERSCLFVASGESGPRGLAGESGAALVYLRFPSPRS